MRQPSDQRRPVLILPLTIAKPMRAVGGLFALALNTMAQKRWPTSAHTRDGLWGNKGMSGRSCPSLMTAFLFSLHDLANERNDLSCTVFRQPRFDRDHALDSAAGATGNPRPFDDWPNNENDTGITAHPRVKRRRVAPLTAVAQVAVGSTAI
jgi:hypothetical protein